MKILKVNQEIKAGISREAISKLGDKIYNHPDVESVFIRINFKDGSCISFGRDEEEDDVEDIKDRFRREK